MKPKHTKRIAVLMAAALTLLPACSGKPQGTPSGTSTGTVAMGRYIEQDCSLPGEVTMLTALGQSADGSLQMIGVSTERKELELYTSADGKTWTVTPCSQLAAAALNQPDAAYFSPDGTLTMSGYNFTDEFMAELEKLGGGYSEELEWPPMELVQVSPDGVRRVIPIELPPDSAGSLAQLLVAPDGDIFARSYKHAVRYDGTTGTIKTSYSMDAFSTSMSLSGNRLAVMANGVATIFDVDSGDRVETVEQLGVYASNEGNLNVSSTRDDEGSVVAVGADGAFYFCNNTGIYRKTTDGELVERLLDGSLVSLAVPSLTITDMLVLPDGILVAFRNNISSQAVLKRYTFDPNVPTLPSKELRIYSLMESKTIRQAISQFQQQNPDTHVVLETAPTEQSTADALRKLNTRLLAGNGPDMLILDGMPTESYIEKKVLMPLDDSVTEGLQPNIIEAMRGADGKLYSVPIRFAVPAVTVDSTVGTFDNVTAIADAAAALSEKSKDNSLRLVLQNCGGAVLLNTLYPLYEQTLQTDGKIDETKLRSFLEQLQRITALQDATRPFVTDDSPTAILDMQWNPLMWCAGTETMGMGYIASFRDFANAATAVTRVPNSKLDALTADGSHPFVPIAGLGICTAGQNTEIAAEFLKLVLSQPIQECDFQDGLPVNRAALDKLTTYDENSEVQLGAYGMTNDEGATTAINIQYPSKEAFATLRGMIDALDTPTRNNRVVLELLRSETAGYFADTTSLDGLMTTLGQKLLLLESE